MKSTTPSSSLFPADNSTVSSTSSPLPGYVNIFQGQIGRYIEGETDARYIGLYTDEITTCHIIIVYGVHDGRMRFSLMHDDSSFSSKDIQKELAFVGEPSQVIVVQNWDKQLLFTSKIPTALRPQKRFLPELKDAVTVSVGDGEPRIDFFSADDTTKLLYNAPQAMRLHVMYKFNLITDEIDAQLNDRKCNYSSEKLLFNGRNFCTYENIDINSMAAFTCKTMDYMQEKSYSSCASVREEMMRYFSRMVPDLSSQEIESRYEVRVSMLAQMYCYLTNQTSLLENNPHHERFMKLIRRYSMRQPQSSETKSFVKQPESSSREGFLTLFRQQQQQKDAKGALSSYNEAVALYKKTEYAAAIERVQFSVKYYRRHSKKLALRNALFLLGRSEFKLGSLEEAANHLGEAKNLEDEIYKEAGKMPTLKYQERLTECESALQHTESFAPSPSPSS